MQISAVHITEQPIPEHIWKAMVNILNEEKENGEPSEKTIRRIVTLAYTAGMTSGLHTALWLCEQTSKKIFTESM
ncbi:MAG TPA: hypothetical protein PK595_05510 [Bacteroidota bacterium]|jgi:hypothetical protein|nr:hypothetical protein [Bacteroidota bacterium]